MRNLLLFLHLAATVFWMGGMAFAVLALRPALHEQLQPPVRLPLMVGVLRRFFVVVIASIGVLLLTGVPMLMRMASDLAPRGWYVMAALGLLMMLIFGYLWFGPWRRMQAAVATANWPEGGRNMNRITLLVKINLGLGWVAIAAVMLWI